MNSTPLRQITPRVLIVDNNEHYVQNYKRLVAHWGFTPVVAQGRGNKLLENAKHLARQERCQFAIVDMRLIDDNDDEDLSGMELIPHMHPAICIQVSARAGIEHSQKSRDAGAVAFLSKGQGPQPLKEHLLAHARLRCANIRGLKIDPPEMLDYIANAFTKYIPSAYHDQIVDVLSELFPKASHLRLEKIGPTANTSHISSVPRPKSVVLRVFEDDKEPVIVKLARRHKIEIEQRNYEAFIEDRLGWRYNTHIFRATLLWDIGGAKLSNIGRGAYPFSSLLQTESVANLAMCLERFFGDTWLPHYQKATPVQDVSLYQLYCSVWGPEWYTRVKTLRDYDLHSPMRQHQWNGADVPHPIRWFIENIADNPQHDASRLPHTCTAITHGDLHGDNLLVDEQYNAWVIDFERSGPGHILQDFVELEADIVNRLDCDIRHRSDFYALCLAICQPTQLDSLPGINPHHTPQNQHRKALAVISHLRRLARQYTAITSLREYLLGLFFNTIFRASLIQENHIHCKQRAIMLASILAHRLQHWDEPWPPSHWPTPQGG